MPTTRTDIFYTPAQVSIYLNSYLVEDACFIRYEAIDNWTPHYGYNDIQFRDVSIGQTIVSGELGIVYRYEGYLTRIVAVAQALESSGLDGAAFLLKHDSARNISDDLLQRSAAEILTMLDGSSENDQEAFDVAAQFLKERFWGKDAQKANVRSVSDSVGGSNVASTSDRAYTQERLNYYRPSIYKSPKNLKLRIVHGSEKNIGQPNYARQINGIQFRGQSYEADIRVPDGSTIITEVYPFIAKDIEPIPFNRVSK